MTDQTPDPLTQVIATLEAQDRALAEKMTEAYNALQAAASARKKVRAALDALKVVNDEIPAEFDGKLADAIRYVLRSHTSSFSATEMRDAIVGVGYDISKHTNILASIHSVLKRMEESPSKDVKSKERADGSGTAYFWAGTRPTAQELYQGSIDAYAQYIRSLQDRGLKVSENKKGDKK